jgi:hypothetical protein
MGTFTGKGESEGEKLLKRTNCKFKVVAKIWIF